MANNLLQGNTTIKASITAIAILLAGISIYPVKADSDSFFSLTLNLSTTTDYSQRYAQTDANPGWFKVQDQAGKSDCYQSSSSREILCETFQDAELLLKPTKVGNSAVDNSATN
ncbi:MAG: hypothetical protein SFT94_06340 [Pseudanabaenaceae cyanobacterium bins.68]|nr:hypothetical protein [Pseudanabaenaceae cyanobacterium bins.68]